MKKRIRNGQYEFPDAEWSRVTQGGQLCLGSITQYFTVAKTYSSVELRLLGDSIELMGYSNEGKGSCVILTGWY